VLLEFLADLGEDLGGELGLLRVGIEDDSSDEGDFEWLFDDTVSVSRVHSEF
jgi:hypothetical protein